MPGADSSPTAAPTDADARALAGGGDVTPRGSPRRSRTRDWHASLNALGEGAEYSEPEPSPVHRASDVSRSSTVAFESSRPSSAGRYSSKSSTGRYSELSRPSRATELATSGGWETPRPSCSPVLVEEEGPAAADTRGLDERLNDSMPPPSQLRRSLSQEVASRPRSRSSIAAAAEEESAVLSPPPQGKVSRTSMAAAALGDAPDNGALVGEEESTSYAPPASSTLSGRDDDGVGCEMSTPSGAASSSLDAPLASDEGSMAGSVAAAAAAGSAVAHPELHLLSGSYFEGVQRLRLSFDGVDGAAQMGAWLTGLRAIRDAFAPADEESLDADASLALRRLLTRVYDSAVREVEGRGTGEQQRLSVAGARVGLLALGVPVPPGREVELALRWND